MTKDEKVETILKSERPWSPTGVAVHNGSVYVLEYTNANGGASEGWTPRVRRLAPDGNISVLALIEPTKYNTAQEGQVPCAAGCFAPVG